jgi:hypothetical protein
MPSGYVDSGFSAFERQKNQASMYAHALNKKEKWLEPRIRKEKLGRSLQFYAWSWQHERPFAARCSIFHLAFPKDWRRESMISDTRDNAS